MPGFVAVGLFFLITFLFVELSDYELDFLIYLVSFIISLIGSFVLYGYCLFIIKAGIYRSNIIPNFDLKHNLVKGIKLFIINLIYFIIPIIITVMVAFITTGRFGNGFNALFEIGGIAFCVAIIGFIIFGIFGVIASARFADSERMFDALNIKAIVGDIGKIGFIKVILFLITITILIIIFLVIASFLTDIPYIGLILSSFIFGAFMILFISRSLGLLYSNTRYWTIFNNFFHYI